MFAVIKTGGKQYLVKEGDVLSVEKLVAEPGSSVSFDVLMTGEGDKINVGTPLLPGKATGEIMAHGREAKISVVKYKAKSRYTRRTGHRQHFTKVKITKIA
ncbi:50S ribosomal protein L21 [Candidatus Uhrbacteria bacterium]|nr:50S ribosomal protein L21 [Candidatus Uhrbacteria bacterium]